MKDWMIKYGETLIFLVIVGILIMIVLSACSVSVNDAAVDRSDVQRGGATVLEEHEVSWRNKINVVELKDGTRCAVLLKSGEAGGAIDCNWRVDNG